MSWTMMAPLHIAAVLVSLLSITPALAFAPQESGVLRRGRYCNENCDSSTRTRRSKSNSSTKILPQPLQLSQSDQEIIDLQRRRVWIKTATRVASVGVGLAALAVLTKPVWAVSKSRTEGYAFQKTDEEWKSMLSPMQYYILREGGTEQPYFSILESEKRSGTFECVACGTPLFESSYKFTSGTGWPSFSQALPGVEVENLNPVQASLGGAELRCRTCGGHLGDVFQDGFLFVGTEAAKSGKRYCIDGAALLFKPSDGDDPVRGDLPAKKKETPSWLEPPKITPKD